MRCIEHDTLRAACGQDTTLRLTCHFTCFPPSHVVCAVEKKRVRADAVRDAREPLGLPVIGCPGDRRLVASEADVGKCSCLQPGT
jgi:hypothetical protein